MGPREGGRGKYRCGRVPSCSRLMLFQCLFPYTSHFPHASFLFPSDSKGCACLELVAGFAVELGRLG